jgi:plasmid stabilization system protein ParE
MLSMASADTPNSTHKDEADANVIGFSHKFFSSFEELYFRMTDTGEPVAVLKMAGNEAILGFDGIRREFGLTEDSPDGRMLAKVAEGLQFVRGLKPGDVLPKEVTTREASWDPTDRHRRIARQRLTMQLVTWLTGDEHIFTSAEELAQVAEDPQVKKNINLAFAEAAEELGLGRERREEVVQYIETLARELAYIEALRDMFGEVKKIDDKVQGLRRLYGSDRSMVDTVDQVARLCQRALQTFEESFDQVDAQTGEILAMLKNIENQTDYIRTARDDLHRRVMAWEDFFPIWKTIFVVRSDENTSRIRDLYQFLAPRFMQVNEWVLVTKRGFEQAKKKPLGGILRW